MRALSRLLRVIRPILLLAAPAQAQWSPDDPIVLGPVGPPVASVVVPVQVNGQPTGGFWYLNAKPNNSGWYDLDTFRRLLPDGTLGVVSGSFGRAVGVGRTESLGAVSDDAGGLWLLWVELKMPRHVRLNRLDSLGRWQFDGDHNRDPADGIQVPVVHDYWRQGGSPQGSYFDVLLNDGYVHGSEPSALHSDGKGGVWVAWTDSVDYDDRLSYPTGFTKVQHYRYDGTADFDSTGLVVALSKPKHTIASAHADGFGGLMTYLYRVDSSGQNVYDAQRLTLSGKWAWPQPAVVTNAKVIPNRTESPDTYIAIDGSRFAGYEPTDGALRWQIETNQFITAKGILLSQGDLFLAVESIETRQVLGRRVTADGRLPWGEAPMLLATDDTTRGDFRVLGAAGSETLPAYGSVASEGGMVALYRTHKSGVPTGYSDEASFYGPQIWLARARRDGGGFSGLPGAPHRVLVCDSTWFPGQAKVYDDGNGWIVVWSAGATVATPGGVLAQRVSPGGLVGRMGTVGVTDRGEPARPARVRLLAASPNPFNPATDLRFVLPQSGQVTLVVHDLLGREVARLADQTFYPAGEHRLRFDGSALSSGMYLVRLSVGAQSQTQRITLLR